MKKVRFRSSRRRYEGFVEDYRLRRLDEAAQGSDGKPADVQPAASQKRRELLREYLRWLSRHRLAIGSVLLLALVVAGLQMAEPLFIRFIIDRVLLNEELTPEMRLTRLHSVGAVFLVVIVLSNALQAVKDFRQRLLNVRVMLALR